MFPHVFPEALAFEVGIMFWIRIWFGVSDITVTVTGVKVREGLFEVKQHMVWGKIDGKGNIYGEKDSNACLLASNESVV